jgi:creatinine amidohydrolase
MSTKFGPLMGEMTWPEVKDAIDENYNVILAVGATEQHGPHLPITTDVILPLAVAKGVAERTKTIVATPLYYGMQSKPLSGGGQGFPGTTSLRGTTLIAVTRDIVGEFIRQGFRKITILTWHMENIGFTYEGADVAMRDAGNTEARVLSIDSAFNTVDRKLIEPMFPAEFPGWDVEHAAIIETSLMLALRPELVRMDRIVDDEAQRHPPYDMIPATPDTIPASGVLYRATLGTKEKGEQLFEMLVGGVTHAIDTEFGG